MLHKATVAKLVDDMTRQAEKLGAVNCVSKDGGTLVGHNTDGEGFLRALETETEEAVEGKSYLIIGAGGAAKAVAFSFGRSWRFRSNRYKPERFKIGKSCSVSRPCGQSRIYN